MHRWAQGDLCRMRCSRHAQAARSQRRQAGKGDNYWQWPVSPGAIQRIAYLIEHQPAGTEQSFLRGLSFTRMIARVRLRSPAKWAIVSGFQVLYCERGAVWRLRGVCATIRQMFVRGTLLSTPSYPTQLKFLGRRGDGSLLCPRLNSGEGFAGISEPRLAILQGNP